MSSLSKPMTGVPPTASNSKLIEDDNLECKQTSETLTESSTPEVVSDVTIPPNFGDILNQTGPIVKAVLLKCDGTAVEVDFDSTPKTMHAHKLIQASPTILGQYMSLEVIVAIGINKDKNLELNKNELRWPFNEREIYGNILLYRLNSECKNVDFTLDEYNEFLLNKSEDVKLKAEWEKDCKNDPSLAAPMDFKQMFKDMMAHTMVTNDNNNDDLGTINEDIDDDDSEEILFYDNDENEETIGFDKLETILREKMRLKYIEENKKEPTSDILDVLTEEAVNAMLEWNQQFEDATNDENDDNSDENEDTAEAQDAKNVDENGATNDNNDRQEEKNGTVMSGNDIEDSADIDENDEFNETFDLAAMSLSPKQRAKILARAKAMYESEMGIEVPMDELMSGFDALNVKIDENTNKTVNKSATVAANNSNNKASNVEDIPLSEEELRSELLLAFEHISKIAKTDEPRIINSLCETFNDMNGTKTSSDQISNIFENIKKTFVFDSNDNLDEFNNIALKNRLSTVQEKFARSLGIKTIYNNETGETSEELRKYARQVVRNDLKQSAKKQFIDLAGRQPTKDEFNEILVQLATTTFVNANFDQTNESDSDYNPISDIQTLINDAKEDTINQNGNSSVNNNNNITKRVKKSNKKKVATTSKAEKTEQTKNVFKGAILTTPVKKIGNSASRVDFYTKSQNKYEKLLSRAIKKFENIHKKKTKF